MLHISNPDKIIGSTIRGWKVKEFRLPDTTSDYYQFILGDNEEYMGYRIILNLKRTTTFINPKHYFVITNVYDSTPSSIHSEAGYVGKECVGSIEGFLMSIVVRVRGCEEMIDYLRKKNPI